MAAFAAAALLLHGGAARARSPRAVARPAHCEAAEAVGPARRCARRAPHDPHPHGRRHALSPRRDRSGHGRHRAGSWCATTASCRTKSCSARANGSTNTPPRWRRLPKRAHAHADASAAEVKPGATKTIIWKFNRAGEFAFGCLIPSKLRSRDDRRDCRSSHATKKKATSTDSLARVKSRRRALPHHQNHEAPPTHRDQPFPAVRCVRAEGSTRAGRSVEGPELRLLPRLGEASQENDGFAVK